MEKRISSTIILSVLLLLVPLISVGASVAASPLPSGLYCLDAKGGVPGRPINGGGGNGDDRTTTYVLNIEIDYLMGHEPTQDALDYIVIYYQGYGISVTFHVDDPIPNTYGDGIDDGEFSAIESAYNDNDNGIYDNWKWVLFGNTVEGEANVFGYCWVLIKGNDMVTGNYIFIADETANSWAATPELEIGAEVTVLMHEIGHSIGIGKIVRIAGIIYEVYDSDPTSVMSTISFANAGAYGAWHYSDDYWATRNMKYYEEIIA